VKYELHSNAVWPRRWMVLTFMAAWLLFELCCALLVLAFPLSVRNPFEMEEIRRAGTILVTLPAVVYGIYRVVRFHPSANSRYLAWLKVSPWRAEKPLPLGPVQLVWQDLVVIGAILSIAHWRSHTEIVYPLAGFGFAYLGCLTLLLAWTGMIANVVTILFLLPTLLLRDLHPLMLITILVALVTVALTGFRNSLQKFPWKRDGIAEADVHSLVTGQPAVNVPPNAGWPFHVLSPKADFPKVSLTASVIASASIGWWTYCLLKRASEPLGPALLLGYPLPALVRYALYNLGVSPPFNYFSRLTTGRLIVPAYDRVFLIPIASLLVGTCGILIVAGAGSWRTAAEASVTAIVFFILLAGSPTLKNWRLTGKHRYRFPLARQLSQTPTPSVSARSSTV
jgi:hypothetical protein